MLPAGLTKALQVGPLPISEKTTIKVLDWMYTGSAHVPFNGRFPDRVRSTAIDTIVAKTMSSIADITMDLTGLQYFGRKDNRTNSQYFVQNPSSTNGSAAIIWTPWRRSGLAPYDQPSDLYVSFDVSGTDETLYKMRMILYNLVVYHSVEEFRAAWSAGRIAKSPPPSTDDSFLRKDRKGQFESLKIVWLRRCSSLMANATKSIMKISMWSIWAGNSTHASTEMWVFSSSI